MKIVALIICLVTFFSCNSVKSSNQSEAKVDIDKWKRATINIECATDSISLARLNNLIRQRDSGKISEEEFIGKTKTKDIRRQGTALFIKYKDHNFLVTARHVLYDTLEAKRYIEAYKNIFIEEKLKMSEPEKDHMNKQAQNTIYPIIFRVENLHEYLFEKDTSIASRKYLRYLGGGWPCYTFSEPKFDIAVISLDRRMTTGFLRDLESNGYQPIVIDSIWNKSIKEGDDLVCIGYPITSRIYRLKGNLDWSASTVSLPTFSFGKIAMTDSRLPFFWGDVSTYPGDSGGPVIRQDTLVGIMSGQATFESQRIPFAYIIKINYLKDLLEKQIELYNEEQILIKSVNVK